MITAGFDIGTRFIKICLVQDATILAFEKSHVQRNISEIIRQTYKKALKQAGIYRFRVKRAIATGYGAAVVKRQARVLPDYPCIARAAYQLNPDIRTVIEIGAHFTRGILLNDQGKFVSGHCNTGCASGSGRFLEILSNALSISFQDISDHALNVQDPGEITNTCVVFAESELISLVNSGKQVQDIAARAVFSIAQKTASLIDSMEASDPLAISGGVSKLQAFHKILSKNTQRNILRFDCDPQLLGAYGAALIAQ